jgi:hypothetical protein
VSKLEGTATTTASPAQVWAQLEDPEAWTRWGRWSIVEVEGGGPQQVGAVRRLVQGRFDVRERITAWEPVRRTAYELLDGLKVTGYEAEVVLDPLPDGGTKITWRSSYVKASPFTAVLLRVAVRDTPKRLAKHTAG